MRWPSWRKRSPRGREVKISYDPDRGHWRVTIEGDRRVHTAEGLRFALAKASGYEADADWIVALEEELESHFDPERSQQPVLTRILFVGRRRRGGASRI